MMLIATLPDRPRLLFAQPGSAGALVWLAARIGRAQRWTIADTDGARLDDTVEQLDRWAEQQGLTTTWPGRAMLIHAPGGAWRIEAVTSLPATLMTRSMADAVLVDVADTDADVWQTYRAPHGRPPLLACLCPTGRQTWLPPRPDDRLLRFSTGSHAAGPARQLRADGCTVHAAATDWRAPPTALAIVRQMVDSAAEFAHDAAFARHLRIEAWHRARMRQAMRGRLAVHVGYRDILAFPPGAAAANNHRN